MAARAEGRFEERVAADLEALPTLLDGFQAWLAGCDCSEEVQFDLALVLDEAFTNVVEHGYGDTPGPVAVCAALIDGEVVLRLIDEAPVFDPLAAPPPELEDALEDRPVGGLGIHLIRQLTDRAEYVRRDGRNVLTLRRSLDRPPG
ncbi:MAG: ATP-binding protein [Methanospirillum sp.]